MQQSSVIGRRQVLRLARKGQFLVNRFRKEQRIGVLRHIPDMPRQLVYRNISRAAPQDMYLSLLWFEQPDTRFEQGTFSGPIMPHNRHKFPLLHRQPNLAQNRRAMIPKTHILDS